jgi:hypothetical protein
VPDSPFPANVSRPDVDAMYGIGGNHGFNIDLSRYEGAQAHVFYVYALGENTNGSYDTKNPLIGIITLPACPPPIGVINSASCGDGTITGWAFDPSHPDTSIQVAVYVGGPYGGGGTQVTGSPITTNLYFDTVNSTYGIGGNHGFSFDISSLRDGNSHIYYVYALGESQNGGFDGEYPQLTGSPVATIACAPFYTSGSASLRLYDSASGNTTYENPNSYSSTDSASVAFCQGASSPNTNCLSYVGSVNPSFHPGLSMSCQAIVDGPNGTATIYGGPVNSDCSSPPGQGISYTVNPVPGPIGTIPTVDATQSYCPVLSIEYSYGVIDSSGNLYQQTGPDTVSPGCQHLYNEPYFKVYGSGVESTCSANGEIGGWNDDNGTNPTSDVNTGVGSGAQLNAIALGDIVGFASGQTGSTYNTLYPAGSGAYRGAGLTFANTNASDIDENGSMINSPKMGGNFNMVTPACDSYSPPTSGTIPLGTDTIDLGNLSTVPGSGPGGSGDYIDTYPGNITIEDSNTAGFAPGTVIKIYADSPTPVAGGQNVYIADPITYDTSMGTTWSVYNQSQSPPLVEIITNDGSIYIDPNVKQLDGLYAAQSNGGSTANIYTCSAANIDGNDWQPMQSQDLYNDCSNQLVVHGSFVASQVNLMRTYGSLRNTVNPGLDAVEDPRINQNRNGCSNAASDGQQFTCAAEVFDFSPELYLSDPDSVYTPAKSGYDSYTSLPPVL